jgi:hypothetical protein
MMTYKGARYCEWLVCPSKERLAAYKAAGIRFLHRKRKSSCPLAYVHVDDRARAAKIDELPSASPPKPWPFSSQGPAA